ncbi:hypothetical protein SAMN05421867_10412 [Cellulomonas marina]|uniref:Integral membrane protein n=1 Tax=Cellulomonas marina TaxID=988821 RepID=A0A1I0WZS7_9CELL|nr:hypothetical protein SAMN05421867_10412 [Cellulomonas marina]
MRPRALAVVATGVLLEAVLLAGLAVLLVVDLGRGLAAGQGQGSIGAVVFLVVLALGVAALLWRGSLALADGQRWPRGPVLMIQVLLVIVSTGWATSGAPPAVLLLTALALVVGAGLLTPSVVAATTDDDGRGGR